MNTLILYYSRDGNTKKVAESISGYYSCDIEEIIDKKNRKGFWGYLIAGRDAFFKKDTEIEPIKKDLFGYNTVFIGTPVWAWSVAPAIRRLLKEHDLKGKKAVLFCTMGGGGNKRTFKQINELLPEAEVISTFSFKTHQVKKDEYKAELKGILKDLKE